MSRGNVFKLSGNMALGGGSDYGNTDIEEIKNSLKLLKAKKNQREEPSMGGYGYGQSSVPSKSTHPLTLDYAPPKADYNY